MKLDGYIRVSRIGGRQGEGYISPDEQRRAVQAYAAELGGEIVAWHDDQDFSGGNLERPGFQAALERIRSGESDGLVVKRIDRFARSVPDGSAIVQEIVDDHGAIFAACEERIDPKTPEGRFMLHSFLANAELFLNRIKSGWVVAKARAVARGAHIGPTPIGYERVPKGQEGSGRLIPHPIHGPALRELFKRAATGKHGDSSLARWLTERAPRDGGAAWQPSEVRRWLGNRVYLGEVRYGDLVNEDAHDALTDPDTWGRCQREPGEQRRAHSKFLLSGLLRCASCRYSMGGFSYGGGKGQRIPVYRCARGRTRGCPEPSVITVAGLDAYLSDLAVERVRGLELEAAADGVDLEALDREYQEAEAKLQESAADLELRRQLGEAGWRKTIDVLAADRDAKLEARDQGYERSKVIAVAAKAEDLDQDGLRDLLDGMIRTVFIRRRPRGAEVSDRALVVWSDDPRAIDLPGPHRAGPFEPVRW